MAADDARRRGEPRAAKCPLCGDLGEPWREKVGFSIQRCAGCGNAFLPRSAIPDDLEALYSREYFEGGGAAGYPSYLDDAPLLERNFARRVRWLRELREPGSILDVGTAFGFFPKAARAAGWNAMGVEIVPDCAEQAARIAEVPVVAGDFLDAALPGGFDVIAMLDVLEHLRDPIASIEKAHELLAPGGWLVIETGDFETPWARLLGSRWYFLDPPNHLHYFTAPGLEAILRSCGFAGEIRWTRLGRWVSFNNIAFKLAWGLPAGGLRRIALALARRRVPGAVYLNFRDGLLMAAQRTTGSEPPPSRG